MPTTGRRASRRRGWTAAGILAAVAAAALAEGVSAAEPSPPEGADVVGVRAEGAPGGYRFFVTIRSPDVSCERYASWWEVVRPDGTLVYRRILMHSHPQEQPFTRAGGPVEAKPDETLVVRAHLHPRGYGGVAMRGSVADGFAPWTDAPPDFAADLATSEPLPEECWR